MKNTDVSTGIIPVQHNSETMYQISEHTIIVSAFNAMIDYTFA